jgi:hypothetical protein
VHGANSTLFEWCFAACLGFQHAMAGECSRDFSNFYECLIVKSWLVGAAAQAYNWPQLGTLRHDTDYETGSLTGDKLSNQ